MPLPRPSPLAPLALALALAGCADPEPPPAGGAGAASSASGAGGGAVASTSGSTGGGAPATCDLEVVPGSGQEITIDQVHATVVDTDGTPVANLLAQVCGINLCKNVMTDATGNVSALVGDVLVQPSFKFGDGDGYAKLGRPLLNSVTDFGTVVTPKLPPYGEGAPLLPGEDAYSAGVTLSIPADGVVDLDLQIHDDPAKQVFRAAAIPKEQMDPAVVDQDPALQMFYAFSPLDARLCPAAKLTAPNDAGFPPGAAVEIFVLGLDVSEKGAPYGGWTRVSDGRVSDDGATIGTSEGGGLPLLTVMGVRMKQANAAE